MIYIDRISIRMLPLSLLSCMYVCMYVCFVVMTPETFLSESDLLFWVCLHSCLCICGGFVVLGWVGLGCLLGESFHLGIMLLYACMHVRW